jgi:1-acyl-sn-glycerol-3-phosphate acyltransferase
MDGAPFCYQRSMLFRLWLIVRLLVGWMYTMLFSIGASSFATFGQGVLGWLVFLKPWARGSLFIMGTKAQIVGAEHLRGPAVFVSNHQSLIDVVFVPALLPKTTSFVVKKELLRVPFWGWALSSTAIMIDRNNPSQAIASIREGLRRLRKGWSVVVFPEGTRSTDGRLQRFKKGAFHIAIETRLPVVPIAMEGAYDIVPKHHTLPRPGTIHVTVGKPIDTSRWTNETIDVHMREVWLAMNECLRESQQRRDLEMGKRPGDIRQSDVVPANMSQGMG